MSSLHEFTGQWFWWGKHGPTAFKDLYLHMYDYFTNIRGLNNLVWVTAVPVRLMKRDLLFITEAVASLAR